MKEDVSKQLLMVGPLPPPIGGASISFSLFCDYIDRHKVYKLYEVINSSPKYFKPRSRIFTLEGISRALRIILQLIIKIGKFDQVVVFGPNTFLLSILPFIVVVSKVTNKPCYVRVFGGSLHMYYNNLSRLFRLIMLITLRYTSGLIVQTNIMYESFQKLLGKKVFYVPGYRLLSDETSIDRLNEVNLEKDLRFVYIGDVKEEKGIYVLLESLRMIQEKHHYLIRCDIYGPIHRDDETRLHHVLIDLPSVEYKGIIPAQQVVSVLPEYDVLLFPTFHPNEGHPGILLEAMIAGVASITTKFQSIPDLVQDGVNGLLVNPGDSDELADSILRLHNNRELLRDITCNNYSKRLEYDAEKVIPVLIDALNYENANKKNGR